MRRLRKLVLGETWTLPLGLAAVLLAVGLAVQPALGDAAGPLLAVALAALLLLVTRRT